MSFCLCNMCYILLLQFLVECICSTWQQFISDLAFSQLPLFTENFQCQAIGLTNFISNSKPIHYWYFIFQDPWDKNWGMRTILEKPFWWRHISSEWISKGPNSLLPVTVVNAISCQSRIHKSSEKNIDWHWTAITEWSTAFPYWPTKNFRKSSGARLITYFWEQQLTPNYLE